MASLSQSRSRISTEALIISSSDSIGARFSPGNFINVLEIPKERIKETASQMLSLFPVDDFTVTEVPLEESIARIFTGEVAG